MDLTALTHYINNLNLQSQAAANRNRIPHGGQLEAQSSANIGNELSGVVNPDVLRLLQQQAAERGVSTGTGGSPNSNAAYLQALGLTSMGIQHQGQADLTAAEGRNPAAHTFDPTTQLITPYESANLNQQNQFERDRMDIERQRLALEAAHAGGGGGGGGGGANRGGGFGGGGGDTVVYGGAGRGGATAADLASTFSGNPTQEWWRSIGFTPGQGVSRGSGTYSFGADSLDPSLFENAGNTGAPAGTTSTTTGAGAPGIDWGSLFSGDLGFDPSLYTGG
jgi:hypothetical protein